jgi:hypothetical protein
MIRLRSLILAIAAITLIAGLLVSACGSDGSARTSAPQTEAPAAISAHSNAGHDSVTTTEKTAALHDAMRKLWEDHITWTRLFIVSATGGLPDLQATTGRLLQNQTDIGDAIKPFYGDAAGTQLTALLKDHILIAADILTAAKAGNAPAVKTASDRWYSNADAIATFLSTANPGNWPLADAKAMMKEHLDLTLAEAVDHLQGDYAADIAAYDKIHTQILGMADMLSAGVIAQFPDKFK